MYLLSNQLFCLEQFLTLASVSKYAQKIVSYFIFKDAVLLLLVAYTIIESLMKHVLDEHEHEHDEIQAV